MRDESADEINQLLTEAEEWERRIAGAESADSALQEAFAEWIRASPLHVRAYLAQLTIQTELDELDGI